MSTEWLHQFIAESNRIEGIIRPPTAEEEYEHARLMRVIWPTVAHLETLVDTCQPGAVLRREAGLNVQVGRHAAPLGGPEIETALIDILDRAIVGSPYEIHCAYEDLHPFTDGNGRSGRALWLWMMLRRSEADVERAKQLGFLHCWYYQTLEAYRP